MDFINNILVPVNNFVWGPIMLVLLVGTGLYLNIGLRFYSFRNWIRAYICLWDGRKHKSDKGEISPWNARMTAIAADIGTGNFVGVATAIAIGGPGALFWMWITALVGMMTKFSEVLLSVHFREKTPAGNWVGGAMYFIKNGLGPKFVWMATAFAIFGAFACFGTGAMVQANAIAGNMTASFGINKWLIAVVVLVLGVIVLIGGVKRVGAVAGRLVPFMAGFYVLLCLIVILMHIDSVPAVFIWVVTDAFTPTAAQGGFFGASVMLAIRMGMARGIFSNEAGLGTAPMAHAASTAESPLVQASIGMLDVFIDTIIVCSMTGFVILVGVVPDGLTGEAAAQVKAAVGDPLWSSGLNGGMLSAIAFSSSLGAIGEYGVSICLALFAFTTALGWCVYGERCAIFLFGDKAQVPFRVLYCICMFLGAVVALDLVWLIADTCNALMAFPNLVGILLLSPVLFKIVREEVKKDNRFVC